MVRILHGADFHLGLTKFGGSYDAAGDTAATLDTFVTHAIESGTDLAIIAGDLFNSRQPAPRHLYAAAKAIARLSAAKVRTVITPGNHDGPTTINDPESHTLAWIKAIEFDYVHVITEEWAGQIPVNDGFVYVVAVPYPHKRAFDIELATVPLEDRVRVASRWLSERVDGLVYRHKGRFPIVFIGHLTVSGATLGTERQMQMGWDVTLDPLAIRDVNYAALGHVHRQQQIPLFNAWYAGSPSYITFSEEGQPKGFLQADVSSGQTSVAPVPSGCRPIHTFRSDGELPTFEPGSIVRLILAEDAPLAALRELQAQAIAGGAAYVRIEVAKSDTDAVTGPMLQDIVERSPVELLADYLDQHDIPREPTLSAGKDLIESC